MVYSRILGTGSYLPERILKNTELEQMVNTSDEWIRSRTGICQRHIASDEESACDIAENAARLAMCDAKVKADEIDLVIVATTTPDLIFPSTACLLQQRLGIKGAAAFDIQAVCTGFIYALSIADKFVVTGAASKVLVVGAEVLSRIIDWSDRDTCVLFADGAGAVVLEASETSGITTTLLHADGSYNSLLNVPSGVSTMHKSGNGHEPYIRMQGNEVFKIAVNTLGKVVEELLSASKLDKGDIDWLVPHQANVRIISAIAKKLDMPMKKVILTISEHGNTSAASIPLALDIALKEGRIKRGEKLLFVAFGAGFAWGAMLLEY